MGLAKIRFDRARPQSDNAIVWYCDWMGGPSLAKIVNCRFESIQGDNRVTAYAQGEADTYFSIPAKAYFMGRIVNGYITSTDDNLVFRHCYY